MYLCNFIKIYPNSERWRNLRNRFIFRITKNLVFVELKTHYDFRKLIKFRMLHELIDQSNRKMIRHQTFESLTDTRQHHTKLEKILKILKLVNKRRSFIWQTQNRNKWRSRIPKTNFWIKQTELNQNDQIIKKPIKEKIAIMNTIEKFLTNFWVKDENEADGEDHQKDWFTDI